MMVAVASIPPFETFYAEHAGEVLGLLARLALTGPQALRRREGLELWYGERRPDPAPTAGL